MTRPRTAISEAIDILESGCCKWIIPICLAIIAACVLLTRVS
jgi:hypothetical protein